MTTYSVRCRVDKCRHRRVTTRDPATYIRPPRCESCGSLNGWRIEGREYNKRGLCSCSGPIGRSGPFPHRATHPFCDQHPRGEYNQLKRQGVRDEDMPMHVAAPVQGDCPF